MNEYSYTAFQGLTPSDLFLSGGAGSGGGGGDGRAVPEPSTLVLAGLSVLAFLCYGSIKAMRIW